MLFDRPVLDIEVITFPFRICYISLTQTLKILFPQGSKFQSSYLAKKAVVWGGQDCNRTEKNGRCW